MFFQVTVASRKAGSSTSSSLLQDASSNKPNSGNKNLCITVV